jgi:hypothetical protein
LTGVRAPSEQATQARVVSVKIENSPEARPQSGLDGADLVYETLTEGGITRFNAIFQSTAPDTVGPVRSARLSDAQIIPQYGALFAHAGGNATVLAALAQAKVQDLDFITVAPEAYWRSPARKAPHDLYTGIERLRAAALARAYPAGQQVRPFVFGPLPADESTLPPVAAVTVPFSAADTVTWTWARKSRSWLRDIDGRAHVHAGSRRQYAVADVVVLWAGVAPTAKLDSNGAPTLDIGLDGSGRATVFRDGTRIDGTWHAGAGQPPVVRDTEGRVVPLAVGRTWFEVVPNDLDIRMR